jgi:hypothetical protein
VSDTEPTTAPGTGLRPEPEQDPAQEPAQEPGDSLPDAPLFALLRSIEREVAIERVDRIWIFPPRRLELGETAVVIVAAYPDEDPDRRRVLAAHYTVATDATRPRLALDEFGTAPTDRVGRVVEDVAERLKDESAAAPLAARIEGDKPRWHELLHSLAERHLNDTLYQGGRVRPFTRPRPGRAGRTGRARGRKPGSGGSGDALGSDPAPSA